MKAITIGLTCGDCRGIGPELVYKVRSDPEITEIANLVVYDTGFDSINSQHDKERFAAVSAVWAIKQAVNDALAGNIDAVVTGPICKDSINQAGYTYSGHTEMIADITKSNSVAMMLVCDNLRVVHVTTHIPLENVTRMITEKRVLDTILLANAGCKSMGVDKPRIGVAGLNPHCSDGGLFGDTENSVIIPAMASARNSDVIVGEKPEPADIVFAKAAGGAYDCVIAMYHDQGHIPVKLLGFKWKNGAWASVDGVNVTLGAKIIRTSPDHGVAFGKAGKGIADPTSIKSAIKLAVKMAEIKQARGYVF